MFNAARTNKIRQGILGKRKGEAERQAEQLRGELVHLRQQIDHVPEDQQDVLINEWLGKRKAYKKLKKESDDLGLKQRDIPPTPFKKGKPKAHLTPIPKQLPPFPAILRSPQMRRFRRDSLADVIHVRPEDLDDEPRNHIIERSHEIEEASASSSEESAVDIVDLPPPELPYESSEAESVHFEDEVIDREYKWQMFLGRDHPKKLQHAIRQMRDRGTLGHYYYYDPQSREIEHIRRTKMVFRRRRKDRRGQGQYIEELHRYVSHPEHSMFQKRQIDLLSENKDPLHNITGTLNESFGGFIEMKENPNVIHICVKNGVQKQAMRLLSEKIFSHRPCDLYLQVYMKKRKTFRLLVADKHFEKHKIATISVLLFKKLGRKKYIHLMLKPIINN